MTRPRSTGHRHPSLCLCHLPAAAGQALSDLQAGLYALDARRLYEVYLVSGRAPMSSTEVLATLGSRYAFDLAKPELGIAAVISTLPLLIVIAIVLMRTLRASEVQL